MNESLRYVFHIIGQNKPIILTDNYTSVEEIKKEIIKKLSSPNIIAFETENDCLITKSSNIACISIHKLKNKTVEVNTQPLDDNILNANVKLDYNTNEDPSNELIEKEDPKLNYNSNKTMDETIDIIVDALEDEFENEETKIIEESIEDKND